MNKYEGLIGKVLDGRYKILELVGMGGMACVLKAQDLVMNRIVAIKILNDEYNGNEQAEARFIDESKAVAMLSNKNIVSVYDVAIYPDIKYIVMEYLDGITLREYLDNKGVIGWKEACIYTLQILRALEHAHSKGIIHRDIKPQNVILMKNGDIKVTDFGIAKLPNSVSETNSEKAVGTVYYISPEQACGQETDYYSDIYSVGIMLYEAVTGTLPFVADTPMDVAMMQVNDEPVHPRDIVLEVPVGVSQIILKAMEKSPSDRFQSAHTMAKAIEWVLRNPDVIFAMDPSVAEESQIGQTSVVSIDMIDTAELAPYDDDDLTDKLDENKAASAAAAARVKSEKAKKKKKKQKKINKTMFPIVTGIGIAFILVFICILIFVGCEALETFTNRGSDVIEVAYPDIVGKYYNEGLRVSLQDSSVYGAKFIIDSDNISYEENKAGYKHLEIIRTEPEGGHKSKPEDGVLYFDKVVVNIAESVEMPDVIGFTQRNAKNILEDIGINVKEEFTSVSENPYFYDGQVVSASADAGEMIDVGSTVTIYVYQKPSTEKVTVPDLVGCTPEYAATRAAYLDLECEIVYRYDAVPTNNVVAISPAPGSVVARGETITLTVSMPAVRPKAPDFINTTYGIAQIMLSNDTNLVNAGITLNYRYFNADNDMRTSINQLTTLGITDSEAFITELLNLEAVEIFDEAPGNNFIVWQSVPAGTEIPPLTYEITVIIVSYSEMNTDTPGSGGESSDISGDTGVSSEVMD